MSGSIYKDKTGKFYFTVRGEKESLTGKRKQIKKRGFLTKKEADIALTDLKNRMNLGTYNSGGEMLISKYMNIFLEEYTSQVTPSTMAGYRKYAEKHLIPFFGNLKLKELQPFHIREFIRQQTDKDYAGTTIKKHYRFLSLVMKQAFIDNLVVNNVVAKVKAPKSDTKEVEILQTKEQGQLLKFVKHEKSRLSDFKRREGDFLVESNFITVWLALNTGMRRGELAGLKWSDIDFDNKYLTVMRSVAMANKEVYLKETKTKKGRRRIDLDSRTVVELNKWKSYLAEYSLKLGSLYERNDLVLPNPEGKIASPYNFSQHMIGISKRSGIKFGLHALRHTHISNLIALNVNIKAVSERAGHSTIEITVNTYGHLMPSLSAGMIESATAKLNDSWNA